MFEATSILKLAELKQLSKASKKNNILGIKKLNGTAVNRNSEYHSAKTEFLLKQGTMNREIQS